MDIKINLLELASEMAHRELLLQTCIEFGISEDEAEGKITYLTHDVVRYKEEYQDKFNTLYEQFYDSVLALGEPLDDLFTVNKYDVLTYFDCSEEEATEVMHKLMDSEYIGGAINEEICDIGDKLNLKRKEEDE